MSGLRVLVAAGAVLAWAPLAHANGASEAGPGPPTRFERFVLSDCSPCVRDAYPVQSIAVAPIPLPGFPRVPAGSMTRPGEIALDVVRAAETGGSGRQRLGLRVTLLVAGGDGGLFRLGTGLLDEEEVARLGAALTELTRAAATPLTDASQESRDVAFHSGSLRVGVVHFLDKTAAYVQVGDMGLIALRPVWEVPSTLYLSVGDLSALAKAVGEAAAKLRQVRRP